ncbi:MAG: hypothetical protein K8R90_02260 [Candidatus Cloacimonetes bacterium]|nr:hypothetical protein [Candidatus Cloacimonadota bacterium]
MEERNNEQQDEREAEFERSRRIHGLRDRDRRTNNKHNSGCSVNALVALGLLIALIAVFI